MERPSTSESARRLGLHKISFVLVLAAFFVFMAGSEIATTPAHERRASWARFAIIALLSLATSGTLIAAATLKGPYFEADQHRRRTLQARNRALGSVAFGAAWVGTIVWLREWLARAPRIPLYAVLSGAMAGVFLGIAAVWLHHHRRRTWPPDDHAARG